MNILNVVEDELRITLPEGKTQEELISILASEFSAIEKDLYGKSIKINGRVTTGMALFLGHKLAHICKDVSIFDPKMNSFIKAVWH